MLLSSRLGSFPRVRMRSDKTIDDMNKELGHVLKISTRHAGSNHMWTSATLGEYLEFLALELRAKRLKHGLSAKSKALIIMDKATVHQSATFEKLRDRFQRSHNVILIHGASFQYVAVPGGSCAGVVDIMLIYVHINIYVCRYVVRNIAYIYNMYVWYAYIIIYI